MAGRLIGLLLALSSAVAAGVSGAGASDRTERAAPGYLHGCALTREGAVYCWGMDHVNGRPDSTTTANRVEGLPPALSLSSGHVNSCVLDPAGVAWCWGMDLQASVRENRAVMAGPRPVSGLPPATMISSGFLHSCAIAKPDGSVWCWGANEAGELGDGSTTGRALPVRAGTLVDATWIATGVNNSCAVLRNGELHCWGTDLQTGEGQIIKSKAPVLVPLGEDVTKVANGRNFACALTRSRQPICFGSNILNQLGDRLLGKTYGTTSPRDVLKAVDVGAGGFYGCALLQDGRVTCWGHHPEAEPWNFDGSDPATVGGLAGVQGLGVGLATSCVVMPDGRVLCWGNNQTGQTGSGRTSDVERQPVEVLGLPREPPVMLQPVDSHAAPDRRANASGAESGEDIDAARWRLLSPANEMMAGARVPRWWAEWVARGLAHEAQQP